MNPFAQFTALALSVLLAVGALAQPQTLPALGADPTQTSVSGLSSGAYMAVQLQVAYSKDIVGAGIVAGGPYYCSANNFGMGFVNQWFSIAATTICMGQSRLLTPQPSIQAGYARRFAQSGLIDPLSQLATRRLYVFSGGQDELVRTAAVKATVAFFGLVGVKPENMRYRNHPEAGHAVITPGAINDCPVNASPYISHCGDYDQAREMLEHIYAAPLNPPSQQPAGRIVEFDQQEFARRAPSMADTGYLYVPPSCSASGSSCKVHVALHGCMQSAESVGDRFYRGAGYNRWADSNQMLVLYPQVNQASQPDNPLGCWDWQGYTGSHYADKSAPQMKAIMQMVTRLSQARH